MNTHDKAIEAACRVVWVQDEGYPIFGKDRGDWIKYEPTVRRAIAAFLRAWEPPPYDPVTAARMTADELDGGQP